MAQPTPYNRAASFSNIQAQAPRDPLPGTTVDNELNRIKRTLDEVLANLELVQRDDGALKNASVGYDQLSAELSVGINPWTTWVTATAYAVGDTVFHGSAVYRTATAHTAGTFATDLGAAKWTLIIDLAALTLAAASNIANTPAGSIAATTVQAAIDELALEKAATSHTHPSSAITDGTAAGRALFTAANVAAQQSALGLGALALQDTVPVTAINAQIAFTGIIEPAALGASVNDWAPTGIATASTIRLSASTTGVNITGILAPAVDGDIKMLENVGTTYTVTLLPMNASSAAANRIYVPRPVAIDPNKSVVLKYDLDGTTPRWRVLDGLASLPEGHLFGLTLANNGSDATNDIDIAAGSARGTLGRVDLVLTSAVTKRLDADWAAGSAAGGRYSGAAITDTTYHTFLIGKADGTTDVFFYAGIDPSAVLPAGYIDYRRIGSFPRESGVIAGFVQDGDLFTRKNVATDHATTAASTNAILRPLSVPSGIRVRAIASVNVSISSSGSIHLLVTDPSTTDVVPTASINTVRVSASTSDGDVSAEVQVMTNTSAQVRSRIDGTGFTFYILTKGWIDTRGRLA